MGQTGGRDHAAGHAAILGPFGQGRRQHRIVSTGIEKLAGGHADRTGSRFQPGHQRRRGAGRVGDLGIGIVVAHQGRAGEIFKDQRLFLTCTGMLADKDPRRGNGRNAHPVRDEQDHIARLLRSLDRVHPARRLRLCALPGRVPRPAAITGLGMNGYGQAGGGGKTGQDGRTGVHDDTGLLITECLKRWVRQPDTTRPMKV